MLSDNVKMVIGLSEATGKLCCARANRRLWGGGKMTAWELDAMPALFKLNTVCFSLVTGRGLMEREEINIRGDWDVTGLSPIHSRPYHPVVFSFVGINAHGSLREETG